MSIHPHLELEAVLQIGDKTRLNGTGSFVTSDEADVTLVEIEVEAAAGFIDITPATPTDASLYYYDFAYSGISRTVDVTIRITTDGSPVSVTQSIELKTVTDDMLFTKDSDIFSYESELKRFFPVGKNSFLSYHRKARDLIIDWLDDLGYRATDDTRITPDLFLSNDQIRNVSENWTLLLIYSDLENSVGDKFTEKRQKYETDTMKALNKKDLRIDLNKDGEQTIGEKILLGSTRIVRD